MRETHNPHIDITLDDIEAVVNGHVDAPLNIPLFRKTVEWVESQAALEDSQSEWDQWSWINQNARNECGTSYCFADYIAASLAGIENIENGDTVRLSNGDNVFVGDFAAYHLGVKYASASGTPEGRYKSQHLFYGGNSASDIREICEVITGEQL